MFVYVCLFASNAPTFESLESPSVGMHVGLHLEHSWLKIVHQGLGIKISVVGALS